MRHLQQGGRNATLRGIPRCVGYHASWDTVLLRGIPRCVGYRAGWDTVLLRGQYTMLRGIRQPAGARLQLVMGNE